MVVGVTSDRGITIPYTLTAGRTYLMAASKSSKSLSGQFNEYTVYLYDPLADVLTEQTEVLEGMLTTHGASCRLNVGCYRNGTTGTGTANPLVDSRVWDVRFDNRPIKNRFEFLHLARQAFSYRKGVN